MTTNLEHQRRKLRFRALHRGIKEMDVVMGAYVRDHLDQLDGAQLAQFEKLLEITDADLMEWMTGRQPIPEQWQCEMMTQLLSYRFRPEDY